LEFLKTSIADLITLLFSSLQNSEGGGDSDSGDSCADPSPPISKCQNLTCSLSPSLLRLLAKTKIVARVNVKKIKAKKLKKGF
jgi:hypothetical protein